MHTLDKYEKEKSVGDLNLIKGQPVYIWGGMKDPILAEVYTQLQKDFYDMYGAKYHYEMNPNFGHWFKEKTVAHDVGKHLLENIPGTGFNPRTNPVRPGDPNW